MKVLAVEDRKEWEDEARPIHEVKRFRALSKSFPHLGQERQGGGPESGSHYPSLSLRAGLIMPATPLWQRRSLAGAGLALTLASALFAACPIQPLVRIAAEEEAA